MSRPRRNLERTIAGMLPHLSEPQLLAIAAIATGDDRSGTRSMLHQALHNERHAVLWEMGSYHYRRLADQLFTVSPASAPAPATVSVETREP